MRNTQKSVFVKVLLLIMLLLLAGYGFIYLRSWEQQERDGASSYSDEIPELERKRVYYGDKWYVMRENLSSILLIGVDKFSDDMRDDPEEYINGQQADFLLLMIIDDSEKCIRALHINRDTMAEIDRIGLGGIHIDTIFAQLALSHAYGSGGRESCSNTVRAVSRFLYDVPVSHYYSVMMDAIPIINDMVGGVTVYVEDDFSRADPSIKQGMQQRLVGQQALSFVRSRSSMEDSSNLSRMRRQAVYMEALYESLDEALKKDDGFSMRLGLKLSDYSVSDLTTDELSKLADRVKDYQFLGIESVEGEAVVGEKYMEFYVNEEALIEQVIRLFFEPES